MLNIASQLAKMNPASQLFSAGMDISKNISGSQGQSSGGNLIEQLAGEIMKKLLGGDSASGSQGASGNQGSGSLGGSDSGIGGSNQNGGSLLDQLVQQTLGKLVGESLMKQLTQGLGDQQNQDALSQGLQQGLSNPQGAEGQQAPGALNSPQDFNQLGNAIGGETGNGLGSAALENSAQGMDALRQLNASDAKGKTYHELDQNSLPVAKEVGKFMDAHPDVFGKSDQSSWEKDVADGRINDKMIDKFMGAKSMLQDAMSGTANPAFQDASLKNDAQGFAKDIAKLAVDNPGLTAL